MELRHLRYFVAVADNAGFGRAARLMNVAQSAISEQVRDLENELGITLIDRSNRSIALTVEGEQFLEDAKDILNRSQQAIENLKRMVRGEIGALRIAFFIGGTGSFFPALIKDFRKQFPGVKVQLVEMPQGLQLRALENGQIDIGFTRTIQPADTKKLSSEYFQTEQIYAVLLADHPLAKRSNLMIRELADERFIVNDRKYSPVIFDKIITLCSEAGFSPTLGANATDASGALALVHAGEGIAILPQGSRVLSNNELVFVPLADRGASVELVVAWSPAHERPLIHSFLDVARKRRKKATAVQPIVLSRSTARS